MYTGEKKVTHSSNETIASGYYQATVTLSTAERKAVKSDIVHIGAGQTTTLNWTFAEADFSTIVTDIWLLGVNNEWQTYGVANKLTQTANGTFVWEGEMSHAYFRFSLEPTTGWPNDKDRPNRFQPAGNDVTISFDTPVDMTYVPKNTDPVTAWNLGGAGYYKFVVDPYEKTVVVTKPAAVTGVVINGRNVTLNKGTSNAFTAVVNGHNTPSQAVTWSITSGHVAGMAFSGNTLTIDSAETASTLTVRATSTADLTKYGEITVTVQEAAAPVVTSIVVTSAGNAAEVSRSGTLQFSKTVTASNGATEDVTWSVSGKDKNGASYSFTSSIDTNGLLTVDENEAAVDLVVRATSRESGYTNIYGEATVFVRKYNDIYAIGDDFSNGWNTATSGSKMTYDGRGVYKLTDILLTKAHTFKFRDSTPTDWNNGNWFHAGTATDDDKTIGDKWVGVRNSSGDNSWKVTHGGKYTITLNTGSMVVAFESTKQVITITGGPSALAPGENGTFTYTTTITGASAPVTWNVYGDGVDRHVPQNNTDVSNGFLTLGSGEWIGHKLFVTVTSLGETVESKQYPVLAVPIIDPEVYIAGDMSNWNDGTKMERGTTPATLHLFTWAGSLSTDCYFRMYRGPGISGNDKPWFTPPTDDAYGINSGHCINLSVVRWDNSGTTNRNWKITPWGDGQYTITFNAADRTLDVTKN
ncbi:MAG: hypothetical protein LBB98_14955 [Treponema sp.]|jgi:hypothetical protein|nr:hypothetical protein [Treponema sp.]